MTEKEFLKAVSNGKEDVLQIFFAALSSLQAGYCIIGGLAVNAYAEPVVSLDLDVVVAAEDLEAVCRALESRFTIRRFEHSVNLGSELSDLRIQLQTDVRYRDFISRSSVRTVLGYEMRVACVEDVLQGKVWAYLDEERRKSKRQKDLADIMRLVETHPALADGLPEKVLKRFEQE
jgi:hypothetical protein